MLIFVFDRRCFYKSDSQRACGYIQPWLWIQAYSVRLCTLKLRHSAEVGWKKKRIIYINFWISELILSARRFRSWFGLFTFSHLRKQICLPWRKLLGAKKVRVPTARAALKALLLLMMSIWRPLARHGAAGLVSVQKRRRLKGRGCCVNEENTHWTCLWKQHDGSLPCNGSATKAADRVTTWEKPAELR